MSILDRVSAISMAVALLLHLWWHYRRGDMR